MSDLEQLQRSALINFGAVITPNQVPSVRFVKAEMLQQLNLRLGAQVETVLDNIDPALRSLESELSGFLQKECVHPILECVSTVLRADLKRFRLRDVLTKALISWLAEIETSSSSSVLADGDSGDSVAADPRNNGSPDTSEKGVNGDA